MYCKLLQAQKFLCFKEVAKLKNGLVHDRNETACFLQCDL